jgi:hypothetical protein
MSSFIGNHRDCKNGLATHSHPSAINILMAGIFLLCPNAALSVSNHSNLSSAL